MKVSYLLSLSLPFSFFFLLKNSLSISINHSINLPFSLSLSLSLVLGADYIIRISVTVSEKISRRARQVWYIKKEKPELDRQTRKPTPLSGVD